MLFRVNDITCVVSTVLTFWRSRFCSILQNVARAACTERPFRWCGSSFRCSALKLSLYCQGLLKGIGTFARSDGTYTDSLALLLYYTTFVADSMRMSQRFESFIVNVLVPREEEPRLYQLLCLRFA